MDIFTHLKERALLQATTEWRTEHGGKYLVQLCKHFAHKIDVSYSET
ncbi:DUF2218 domain-containing protein, partial [Neorhizobium galegae]|nr:DUF2218 domain-containing protein [Neorhizobium galegae]